MGSYLVEVSPPLGDTNVTVAESPLNMTLLAAAPDAMRSQCTVTAAHWNIGTPITIKVELIDAYGNTAAMPEDACQVELYGEHCTHSCWMLGCHWIRLNCALMTSMVVASKGRQTYFHCAKLGKFRAYNRACRAHGVLERSIQ